jgi:TRAP-type mannitol/chloroaromatic compound transport system permease small subunit
MSWGAWGIKPCPPQDNRGWKMKKLVNAIDRVSTIGGVVAAMLIVAMVLLIVLEIGLRTIFATSTLIAHEYAAYFLACLVFLGLAYTLRTEGHIRIGIIVSRLSPRKQAYLNVIGAVIALAFSIYLSMHLWNLFHDSFTLGRLSFHPSRTPLAIPQFFLLAGSVLLALQFAAYITTTTLSLIFGLQEKHRKANPHELPTIEQ